MGNTDRKTIPVEPADIEDAVRRLWQLEDFLEDLVITLYDNEFFPKELADRFEEIYVKKF
jgi:hypothetical protein